MGSPIVLFGLLLLNFGISAWNAYASGAYLTETKIIGGWPRALTWCGLVMSACGFTWCYLTVLSMVAVSTGHLPAEYGLAAMELGYLIIILPIIGSGLAIWADSVTTAWRERTFGSMARAGWNTYAQASNMWDAARHAPGMMRHVGELLGGKGRKKNDGAAILVFLLVILALAGGALTTAAIARWADRRIALDVGSTRLARA